MAQILNTKKLIITVILMFLVTIAIPIYGDISVGVKNDSTKQRTCTTLEGEDISDYMPSDENDILF